MKTKLLFLFSLVTFSGFSQSPIVSFTPNTGSPFALYTADDPLDQSPEGANAVWNLTGFSPLGTSGYSTSAPTAGEVTTFPGSTGRLRHAETVDSQLTVTDIFFKSIANDVSITGFSTDGLVINYGTNNAHIGTYPLEYGFDNSDAVAGNYVYDTYSGTFSGTITTSVDAYGTLSTNINTPNPQTVTRMKTTQNLSMNYGPFTNVGTFTQTIWDYFTAGSADPALRVTTTSISIPLLSVNENTTLAEMFVAPLATQSWQAGKIAIAPNPVENVLNIQTTNNQKIKSVSIADATGKIVLTDNSQNQSIEVSQLQQGVYFATVVTDAGTSTKKIMKK